MGGLCAVAVGCCAGICAAVLVYPFLALKGFYRIRELLGEQVKGH